LSLIGLFFLSGDLNNAANSVVLLQ